MQPSSVPNLINAIAKPPWREDLDWNLHVSSYWEKLIPFRYYVQPVAVQGSSSGQPLSLPVFYKLPIEIQFYILTFCPPCTLYQIMRACTDLRKEASKLFWATPDMYFLVEGSWLLEGGYSSETCWDPSFYHHVQNVQIEFRGEDARAFSPRYDRFTRERLQPYDRITFFWEDFSSRFPNAKRVIINYTVASTSGMIYEENQLLPLRAVAQACPVEMVYLRLNEQLPWAITAMGPPPSPRWEVSFYQPRGDGKWEKAGLETHHNVVMMPMKQFVGPVGEFQKLEYQQSLCTYQNEAIRALMIEAVARLFCNDGVTKSFTCPHPACNLNFSKTAEWITHAAYLHHGWRGFETVLPDELRVAFEERAELIDEASDELGKQMEKLREEWVEAGSKKQQEIAEVWMGESFVEDLRPGQEPDVNNSVWFRFLERMSGNDTLRVLD